MTLDGADRIRAACQALAEALIAAADSQAEPAPDRLLDVDEAAAALGIGRSVLYGLIARGELGSVTVGRRRLVPAASIARFIAERSAA